jgi:post-segregation antitoxin (ccd killing protein)
MKKRTTIYLDEEVYVYVRKHNINLSELLRFSIQNKAKSIQILKKKLVKTQENLANLTENAQILQENIQKELKSLRIFYSNLTLDQKTYIQNTRDGVVNGNYSLMGRYKSYIKRYGEIDLARFNDLLDHIDILTED